MTLPPRKDQSTGANEVSLLKARVSELEGALGRASHMLDFRTHQLKLSGDKWCEAAEEALAGNPAALRNRVEMRKLGPVEFVQSDEEARAVLAIGGRSGSLAAKDVAAAPPLRNCRAISSQSEKEAGQ